MRRADVTKFLARLPSDLHEDLAEAAKRNERSMNAELVYRLGDSLRLEAELEAHFGRTNLVRSLVESWDEHEKKEQGHVKR